MTLQLVPAANQVIERCESTNDLARKLGETGAPHGTWISARIQEKGRGRLGRKWESLEGNLFLSMIARIDSKALWSWVPLTTAVAVAGVLRRKFPERAVKIKWPNDLWINGAKVGGILCEGVGNRDGSFIIIGLGLNCAKAPEGLDQETASLDAGVDAIREAVVQAIPMVLDELQVAGPSGIVHRYNQWAALPPGTAIEWLDAALPFSGEVEGLGESGELKVRSENGESIKLYAEDVKVRAVRKAGDESPA